MFLTVQGYQTAVTMARAMAVKQYPYASVTPVGWDVSANYLAHMDNHKRISPVFVITATREQGVIAYAIDTGNAYKANVSVTVDGGVKNVNRKVVQELHQVVLVMAIVMKQISFATVIDTGKALDVTYRTAQVTLMTVTTKVCVM